MRISGGNVYIGGTSAATADIALNANGSATFAGSVSSDSAFISSRSTGNGCFYAQLDGTTTAQITSDGSAEFAGNVKVGDYQSGTAGKNGFELRSTGELVQNRNGGDAYTLYNNSAIKTVTIQASGSAQFAGNVGIGTSSPTLSANSTGMHIHGSASGGSRIHLTDGNTGTSSTDGTEIVVSGSDLYIDQKEAASTIFFTNGNERMRITSSGNVGINNSSPSSYNSDGRNLVVGSGSGSQGLTIASGTSGYGNIYFADGTSGNALYSGMLSYYHADNHMQFRTASEERMRIDSSGNVYMGTTSDPVGLSAARLHAKGTGGNAFAATVDTAGFTAYALSTISGGYAMWMYNTSTSQQVGSIYVGHAGVTYNTTSDYRLKENVVDLTAAIPRLKTLPVHRFNFLADKETTVDGFLAHEAQLVVPESVTGTHNEVDSDGNPVYQGIDQAKLVPLLTAALQEAIGRIETLETKVAALEAG